MLHPSWYHIHGGRNMRLTLAEPKYFKESISIISDLVSEARLKFSSEGVQLAAMDPANVAMVIFKLFSSAFTEYDIKKPIEIGVKLSDLKQILRRVNPSDMLSMDVTADNRLEITLKGKNTRTFSMALLELEDKEQRIPELKFGLKVETDSSIFVDAIEDADIVGESVSFICDEEKLVLNAEGDFSKADIEVRSGEETKIAFSGHESVKAKYSIEYLKKMIGGAKIADQVTIQFNKDYPLRLDFVSIDKVQLGFILAPRVEND
jgi:proliferating cell nuclear antigen